jgi:hypothetical protein
MISGGLRGVKESTDNRSSIAGPVFVITIGLVNFVTLDETLCYFQGVFRQEWVTLSAPA